MIIVRLEGFTPKTYAFMKELVEQKRLTGKWFYSSAAKPEVPLESVSALYFILRGTDDYLFPGGKWATIQLLELLIDKAVAGR